MQPAPPTAATDAATYEHGRVFLKGNPLQTTVALTCPHCKLPRLKHPIAGKGGQTPDLSKEYCMLYPWVQRPGHDIYGNPFPTDQPKTGKKKEKELLRQKHAEKDAVGTPNSQDMDPATGDAPATATSSQGKEIKLNTGGKPATYVPWQTCPKCKRSLLITRYAQHLEKCLGISGRQSSRNAMARMSAQGTGVANTPLGSRVGTPVPGFPVAGGAKDKDSKRISPAKKAGQGDDEDNDDMAEAPPQKKKKKSSYIKKADRERMAKEAAAAAVAAGSKTPASAGGPLKVKLKTKDLPSAKDTSQTASKAGDGTEKGETKGDGKRERDDAGDEAPRKKLKLTLPKDGTASSASARKKSLPTEK